MTVLSHRIRENKTISGIVSKFNGREDSVFAVGYYEGVYEATGKNDLASKNPTIL